MVLVLYCRQSSCSYHSVYGFEEKLVIEVTSYGITSMQVLKNVVKVTSYGMTFIKVIYKSAIWFGTY